MADLKQLARRIFLETLAAIDVPATMQRKVVREGPLLHCVGKTVDLRAFDHVHVIAIGKAAHGMLQGLASVLPGEIVFDGMVAAPTPPPKPMPGVQCFVAGHPLPNAASWKAAEATLALLKTCDARTLVFFLLSGGGSALLELPLDSSVTLEEVRQLYDALVTCGAPIGDIGVVRRHVSAVKGGRLAIAAGPATKITLAVSDVPVGQESALASGPTLPDPTTTADVRRLISEYVLQQKLPTTLQRWIGGGEKPGNTQRNKRTR